MKSCSIFYFFKLFSITFIFISYGILFCSTSPGTSLWSLSYNISLELDAALSGGGATSNSSTPIEQSGFSGGTYTISSAGTFHLAESVAGDISIEASKVYLNLNSYTCTGDIDVTTGLEKIKIRNGFVVSGDVTILNSSNIQLEDIVIDTGTFYLNGTSNSRLLRCNSIGYNYNGIKFSTAHYNLVQDCVLLGCNFYSESSDYNVISRCCVADLSDAGIAVVGFRLVSGSNNLFTDCIAKNIGPVGVSSTMGFYIWQNNTILIRCIADTVASTANSYGILVIGATNCLVRDCEAYNCGDYGIAGQDADIFNGTDGNVAIQNIAYNNGQNYRNFPATAVQDYNHTTTVDITTYFDNVAIPDNT